MSFFSTHWRRTGLRVGFSGHRNCKTAEHPDAFRFSSHLTESCTPHTLIFLIYETDRNDRFQGNGHPNAGRIAARIGSDLSGPTRILSPTGKQPPDANGMSRSAAYRRGNPGDGINADAP